MEKRIKEYRKWIDELLTKLNEGKNSGEAMDESELEAIIKDHLVQISFFQHERLVHLLVTLAFAIMTILSIGLYVLSGEIAVLALCVLLIVLLVPYIRHYYILENYTQAMYAQYDELKKLLKGVSFGKDI